jgi:hypothetical protein
VTVEIQLTKGYVAIVDDEDADLSGFSWTVLQARRTDYARGWLDGKQTLVYMHRVIAERVLGHPPLKGELVDHWNHNGCDNRRGNLRIVTQSQNMANQRIREESSSGYKGVCWVNGRQKWVATIGFNRKRIHIGYFVSKADAARAYNAKAQELYGEHAYLNPIEDLADSVDCPAVTGDV